MSKLGQQRRFVPLLLADDYQSVPPLPPGDGDGDGDIPTGEDLCAVEIEDGGGDTFDCYEEEMDVVDTVLDSGTAWTGVWFYGDSDLNNPRGDTFDGYPEGAVVDNTLNQGQSQTWNGAWRTGDGNLYHIDDFESYTDGTYTSGQLGNGQNLGSWQSES